MEDHVESYGVEPMCRALRIAPSIWHEHVRRKADPDLRSVRAKDDERPSKEIVRVHTKNFGAYGAKKVWLPLNREGFKIGCDRVAWLMARPGLEGVVRGKVVRTTTSDKVTACPLDLVKFHRIAMAPAPSMLWMSELVAPRPPSAHLRLNMDWLRPCGLCDRRLRQTDRRLAGQSQPDSSIRSRCPGAGPEFPPPN